MVVKFYKEFDFYLKFVIRGFWGMYIIIILTVCYYFFIDKHKIIIDFVFFFFILEFLFLFYIGNRIINKLKENHPNNSHSFALIFLKIYSLFRC
jgi:hypothetical protein